MISIDGSVVIQIINFLLLVWLMNKIVYKPIRAVLQKRKDKIGELVKDADRAADQAKVKDALYTDGIRAARKKGVAEKEKLIAIANQEEHALISDIQQKMQEELETVRLKIADEMKQARTGLEQEIDGFAAAIGQKILGRAI